MLKLTERPVCAVNVGVADRIAGLAALGAIGCKGIGTDITEIQTVVGSAVPGEGNAVGDCAGWV